MANILLGIITAMKKNKAWREMKQLRDQGHQTGRSGIYARGTHEGRECGSWRTEERGTNSGQDKGCGAETSSLCAEKCKEASMVRAE